MEFQFILETVSIWDER